MNTTPATETTARRLLIGGAALRELGSSRATEDMDYLVHVPGAELFIKRDGEDLVNAAAHPLFAAVWEAEAGNIGPLASPQSLLVLKAFALIQHVRRGFFQKADDAEFDIRFIVRQFGATDISLLADHVEPGEMSELRKIVAGVRK